MTPLLKYYISTIIIFIAFLCVSGLALAINLESEASVVAVGDNLIHPEVYNDAKTGKIVLILNLCTSLLKRYKMQILHTLTKNLRLVVMIDLIMDLSVLIHLVV